MKLWKRTDGSSALKESAITALRSVTSDEFESESVLRITPDLPDLEVARVSIMYYTQEYPTQEQLKTITEYLEVAYELRCQYANVDVSSGKSWTDPDVKFMVTVSLQGKVTK